MTSKIQQDNQINDSLSKMQELTSNCPDRHQKENFSIAFLLQLLNFADSHTGTWLQQACAELETQVKQSTEELARSNDTLQAEITERKKVEAQLRAQEQFLRGVFDGSEHAIFVVDVLKDGNFCFTGWNQATERATGISSDRVIGATPEDVYGEIEGASFSQKYRRCLAADAPITYEECLILNNQETWWLTTINPLKDGEEKIYRLVGTTLEISDRKQAEIQLQRQKEELETTLKQLQRTQMQLVQSEKMSSLGQLVAGVAHEINNPVNFIYGNLTHAHEYIQDLLSIVQTYQKYYPHPVAPIEELAQDIDIEFLIQDLPQLLNSMKIGAQRIREIVISLRTFSRMDEAEMKEVNIHEGIDSTLMILEHRLKAKSNRCSIQVVKEYDDLPLVECYPGQLNQVFMNILANAIDTLEESWVNSQHSIDQNSQLLTVDSGLLTQPQIHIQTQKIPPHHLSICIADNGAGMTEAVKQRLFDPFFTTKAIGKGTGMGLSISYQIIAERHGGTLECISQLGSGSKFVITIPLCQG